MVFNQSLKFVLALSFLVLYFNSINLHALNIGVQATDASIVLSKDCSRQCESEFCTVPPFLRYGKYCGLLYSGCPGEQPCDGLDACCMKHDNCVQSKNSFVVWAWGVWAMTRLEGYVCGLAFLDEYPTRVALRATMAERVRHGSYMPKRTQRGGVDGWQKEETGDLRCQTEERGRLLEGKIGGETEETQALTDWREMGATGLD